MFKESIEQLRLNKILDKFKQHDKEWAMRIWYNSTIKYTKGAKAGTVEKNIVEYVNLLGHQASKITTSGRMIDNTKIVKDTVGFKRQIGSKKYIPGNSTKGVADIIITLYGLKIDCEIKFAKGDRQRESQKKYQADVERANGWYIIINNEDHFYEVFNEILQHPKVILMKEYEMNN